jgi:XapX domain-containing protein
MALKDYVIALAAGALVGIIYGLINVRSPAPPIIGLIGLVGILIGERAVPLAKQLMTPQPTTISRLKDEREPHLLAKPPVGGASAPPFSELAPNKGERRE